MKIKCFLLTKCSFFHLQRNALLPFMQAFGSGIEWIRFLAWIRIRFSHHHDPLIYEKKVNHDRVSGSGREKIMEPDPAKKKSWVRLGFVL